MLTLVGIAGNAEQFNFDRGDPTESSRQVSRGGESRDAIPVDVEGPGQIEIRQAELPPWVIWVVGIGAGIGTLWFLTRQRFKLMLGRRRAAPASSESRMTEQEQAETIADFAEELIAELEFEQDPRIAIQRVYAAVETGLGTRELRRKPAETPLKYLARVFGRRKSAAPALGRLTELFQVARFSSEPLGPDARLAAIDALRELRDEYRAIARAKVFG